MRIFMLDQKFKIIINHFPGIEINIQDVYVKDRASDISSTPRFTLDLSLALV